MISIKELTNLEAMYIAEKNKLINEHGVIELSSFIPYNGIKFINKQFIFKDFIYEILRCNYGIDKYLEYDEIFEELETIDNIRIDTYGSANLDEFYICWECHIINGIAHISKNKNIDFIEFEKLLKELGVKRYHMIVPTGTQIPQDSKFKLLHSNKGYKINVYDILMYEDKEEKIIIPNKFRICCDCGQLAFITPNEIEYYKSKKLSLPKRCEICRKVRGANSHAQNSSKTLPD